MLVGCLYTEHRFVKLHCSLDRLRKGATISMSLLIGYYTVNCIITFLLYSQIMNEYSGISYIYNYIIIFVI